MQNRYKIILSNRQLYKEVEMPAEAGKLTVGTDVACDVRLRKELFFEPFELMFWHEAEVWRVCCSDNVYVTSDKVSKLMIKNLVHGDELSLKYHSSDADILKLTFMIDFEFEKNDYERCMDISGIQELYIGGTDWCQIYLNNPYVGQDVIVIRREQEGYRLTEKNTRYGVYVNDCKRTGEILLQDRDFIALANYSFYLKGRFLYTSKKSNAVIRGLPVYDVSNSKSKYIYPKFNRSTRIQSIIDTDPLEIQDPSAAPQKPRGNIVLQLLPAIAMLAVTVIIRGSMSSSNYSFILLSVCTMGIGIVTSILGIITGRREYKREIQKRREKYQAYIRDQEEKIQQYQREEANLLEEKYYSLEREISMVDTFAPELFDRTPPDEDYLQIRLGLGTNEALKKVCYKKQDKYDCEDELAGIPESLSEKYRNIANTPVTVDVKGKNSIGIVGTRRNLYSMLKNITLDLAIRHYYTEVQLFYIITEERQEQFRWIRFLPHIHNTELGIRNLVCNLESKNVLFEYLYKELSRRLGSKESWPNLIVFVFDDMGIKKHPISNYMDEAADAGIHFLFFEEYQELLPGGCAEIIYLPEPDQGYVLAAHDYTKKRAFTYTPVSDSIAVNVVNKLAPVYCEEVSLEEALTKNITLFEMLNILSVEDIALEQNWEQAQVYKTMAAPLGINAKNEIVYLDLNERHHGPHGLVAGTTGSGKSEILQTYILSAATLFHPYEVSFLIIDFKGGGMVNQFKDLPHLLGAITNIDGKEIERSLKSIKAELQKRQRWFAEAGVNHIDHYIKKYKEGLVYHPLPHLIIVVDEFAELKAEQPEFMKELISAARIGRSLGVHLILATQKPSGVVDDQIWSNSRFRLCLKVQSKEDSNEVLKTPLAAEIKEPGRAYLQVGNNEIFELFQSAYSGASVALHDGVSGNDFYISKLELSGLKRVVYQKKQSKKNFTHSQNQLEAVVEYIGAYCMQKQMEKLPDICMPPLPELLPYEATERARSKEVFVSLGVLDDPDNQRQERLSIHITTQNYIIIGATQSGKTNILQSVVRGLAENYTPSEVNLYIIDFNSMILRNFADLRHCGGVVCAADDEKLKSLLRLLNEEIRKRKEKFAELGVSSFMAYKEAGFAEFPQIVVFIDNITALKEAYFQEEDGLMPLCRDGVAVGISFLVTNNQASGIGYRYLNHFEGRITLFCNETSEYTTMFETCRMKPSNLPGRCLIKSNKDIYECQMYLSFEGEKEFERVSEIRRFVSEQNAKQEGKRAKLIPEIPKNLNREYIKEYYPEAVQRGRMVLGLNFDTISPVTLPLAEGGIFSISGKKEKGREAFVRYFLEAASQGIFGEAKLYIMDSMSHPWAEYEGQSATAMYTADKDFIGTMLQEIENRIRIRYDAVMQGESDFLKAEPFMLLVIENTQVIAEINENEQALEAFKNIVGKYCVMKVMVIFTNLENAPIAFHAPGVMKLIKEHRRYLLFEDINHIKLCDLSTNITRKFVKPIELYDAYYISEQEVVKVKTVREL